MTHGQPAFDSKATLMQGGIRGCGLSIKSKFTFGLDAEAKILHESRLGAPNRADVCEIKSYLLGY